MTMGKKYRIGIVPGSFDPITLGHLDIIRRAAELCDKVFVAVMINADKEYMFSISERREIAEEACRGIDNVTVISSEGMLYSLADSLSAEAIIKGVRNDADRKYEMKMAEYNAAHYPAAKTLLLEADRALFDISSTLVRDVIKKKGDLSAYLPTGAIERINKILNKNAETF